MNLCSLLFFLLDSSSTQKIKMLDTRLSEKEDELKKQQKSSAKAIKDANEKLNIEVKEKKGL